MLQTGETTTSLEPPVSGGLETSSQPLGHDDTSARHQTLNKADQLENLSIIAHAAGRPFPHQQITAIVRKLRCCSQTAFAVCNEDGTKPAVTFTRCKSRHCVECEHRRAKALMGKVMAAVTPMNERRAITLTLRHRGEPLAAMIARIQDAWTRFRRRKETKQHITGGICVIEVTYNHAAAEWHAHIHAIIEGTYWHGSRISQLWKKITGDSFIVDITQVRSKKAACGYIAKYIGKSAAPKNLPADRLAEYAIAIQSLRMIQTFGTAHATIRAIPKPEPKPPRRRICSLNFIHDAANGGDANAKRLAAEWHHTKLGHTWPGQESLPSRTEAWYADFTAPRPMPPPAPTLPEQTAPDPRLFESSADATRTAIIDT